jgi:hypothetical protein
LYAPSPRLELLASSPFYFAWNEHERNLAGRVDYAPSPRLELLASSPFYFAWDELKKMS